MDSMVLLAAEILPKPYSFQVSNSKSSRNFPSDNTRLGAAASANLVEGESHQLLGPGREIAPFGGGIDSGAHPGLLSRRTPE